MRILEGVIIENEFPTRMPSESSFIMEVIRNALSIAFDCKLIASNRWLGIYAVVCQRASFRMTYTNKVYAVEMF